MNAWLVPAVMLGFVGVTAIELRVGAVGFVEGGVPAQLDRKMRALTESRTETHRRLTRGRPTMIENPPAI